MNGESPLLDDGEESMNGRSNVARGKAGATALLLLLTGGALGVLMDRMWLRPTEVEATALTAEALAAHLDLRPAEEARVRALLDSLDTEMMLAAQEGPDALVTAARSAHARLEAALPPDARPAFHGWMRHHNSQMMERMHRGRAPDHAAGHDEETRH